MDGDQFRSFIKDIWGEDSEAYSKLGNANTDWQKEIFRPAVSTDHNLTISGGLKNMPYRVSFGYTNQNGIVKHPSSNVIRLLSAWLLLSLKTI